MAEWLCSGLQSRVPRFDSGSRLQSPEQSRSTPAPAIAAAGRLESSDCDLLIVGGGINGAGVARDAVGRGLKVVLCEQGDVAGATSSASSKLIHGGLRYLEHLEFGLVRESLAERAILLRAAPHLNHPLRFVIPYARGMRSRWLIRAGLFLYDGLARFGPTAGLPVARAIRLDQEPHGAVLRQEYAHGFVYFDAATDDARLTLANVVAAAEGGAEILPRTELVQAGRTAGVWAVTLRSEHQTRSLRARAIVNAAGPWVAEVRRRCGEQASAPAIRLVRGSHLIVPACYAGDHAYTLQNEDGRIGFLIPFQNRYTLIGTTEADVAGPQARGVADETEKAYLVDLANRYLRRPVRPDQIVASFSGVRPLAASGDGRASAASREYRLVVSTDADGRSPLLSIYGGKLTSYRRLAERALGQLQRWFPAMAGAWTGDAILPGAEFGGAAWPQFVAGLAAEFAALPAEWLAGLARRHGSRCRNVLAGVGGVADLGRDFGGGLYEREVDFFVANEWARRADDILWRRSQCGLAMTAGQRRAFAEWFERRGQ